MGMKMAMARIDLGEGADGVEEQTDRVGDRSAGHVLRAQESERQGQGSADDGAHPGHLERFDHGLEGIGQVRPVRPALQEHLREDAGHASGQRQQVGQVDVDGDGRPEDERGPACQPEVAAEVRGRDGAGRPRPGARRARVASHTSRRRSRMEMSSMTRTMTKSSMTMTETLLHWKKRYCVKSRVPMPPAPTTPMTVEARTLSSKA